MKVGDLCVDKSGYYTLGISIYAGKWQGNTVWEEIVAKPSFGFGMYQERKPKNYPGFLSNTYWIGGIVDKEKEDSVVCNVYDLNPKHLKNIFDCLTSSDTSVKDYMIDCLKNKIYE